MKRLIARFCVLASVWFFARLAEADIVRWDNGQVIPGTEGITPGPGVQLDHGELAFAKLDRVNLTGANLEASNLSDALFENMLGGSNLTNANFAAANFTNARLSRSTLTNADFTGANLTNALIHDSVLTDVKLAGAVIRGTILSFARGFTAAQLYSTASYQAKDLYSIDLTSNDITGWDFSGQNLTNARLFASTLKDANLTDAIVRGTDFYETTRLGFTAAQLYSTASYRAKDLTGIRLVSNDLTGWDFSGQNLTNARFALIGSFSNLANANLRGANLSNCYLVQSNLTDADLTGAVVRGANFGVTSITSAQLYSTASYQAKGLQGIGLAGNDLTGWDFSGQDLSGANFGGASVASTDFSLADLRGVDWHQHTGIPILRNTIFPDGAINGLNLAAGEKLVAFADVPIPVKIVGDYSIAPTATLDLTDNAAIVDYSGTSPVATVRQQVITGRGGSGLGGEWTGSGITSSTAAAANATEADSRSLGYAENSTLLLGPFKTFLGATVDNTSVLIAFTRTGDANLDGVVNDDDVTILGATYASGVPQPHWALGDFDYNGFVDDDDVTLLGAFYGPNAAPHISSPPVSTEVTAVPEPNALLLLCLGFAAVCAMRRLELNTATNTADRT